MQNSLNSLTTKLAGSAAAAVTEDDLARTTITDKVDVVIDAALGLSGAPGISKLSGRLSGRGVSLAPPPRVSIIFPVYNGQRYLEQAVNSILRQTFDDFELILIDDGSTDDSMRCMSGLPELDSRVRLVRQPHEGVVRTLNNALALARGEFIARMDQDDVALPHRLQLQVEFLDRNPDHVMVGSRVMLIDPDGEPICEFARESTHDEVDQAHLSLRWAVVHPTMMVRREALFRVGCYRLQYEMLEDLDLFLRLAEIGKIANIPEVLLHYRKHPKSICEVYRARQNAIRQSLYREMRARRGIACASGDDDAGRYRSPVPSLLETHRTWAWQALEAGNVGTARKHSRVVIRRNPFSVESWRLLLCAMRGH